MNKRRCLLLIPLCMTLLALLGCATGVEYTADFTLPAEGWNKDSTLVFEYENHDTIARHDLYFYIRHNEEYPHANLYLYLEVETPQQLIAYDTVNYNLASPRGEWYGKGWGTTRQLLLPYHKAFAFGERGRYRFHIRHGMRYERLLGVEDFGLQIFQYTPPSHG